MKTMAKQLFSLLQTRHFSNAAPFYSQFNSSISLKRIYPNSSLDITKPFQMSMDGSNNNPFNGYIPLEDVDIKYSRSSGPGGQHVNKVNSKVDMRFHLQNAKWLSSDTKQKMEEKYKTSINAEGYLIIKSERTRSQQLNLADAMDKLRHMIIRAEFAIPPPSSSQLEITRRRQEKATRERLRQKRAKSLIKKDRQGLDLEL